MDMTTTRKETARARCRRLTEEAEQLLAALAEREGLTLQPKTSRYDRDGGTFTIAFDLVSEVGQEKEKERARSDAALVGLPESCIGQTFRHKGRTFEITDIVLRRPKYPVSARRDDGKTFKFPAEAVQVKLLQGSGEQEEDERLFWDEKGHIACPKHAPAKGSDTWIHGRWKVLSKQDRLDLGNDAEELCRCETCGCTGGA
jgi:hypothetical protein